MRLGRIVVPTVALDQRSHPLPKSIAPGLAPPLFIWYGLQFLAIQERD